MAKKINMLLLKRIVLFLFVINAEGVLFYNRIQSLQSFFVRWRDLRFDFFGAVRVCFNCFWKCPQDNFGHGGL